MVALRDREILDGFGADPADSTIIHLFRGCSRFGLILFINLLLICLRSSDLFLRSGVVSAPSAASSRTSSASSAVHPSPTWSTVLVIVPGLSRSGSSSRHYVFARYGSIGLLGYEESREGWKVVTDRSALMSMTSTSEPQLLTVIIPF